MNRRMRNRMYGGVRGRQEQFCPLLDRLLRPRKTFTFGHAFYTYRKMLLRQCLPRQFWQ